MRVDQLIDFIQDAKSIIKHNQAICAHAKALGFQRYTPNYGLALRDMEGIKETLLNLHANCPEDLEGKKLEAWQNKLELLYNLVCLKTVANGSLDDEFFLCRFGNVNDFVKCFNDDLTYFSTYSGKCYKDYSKDLAAKYRLNITRDSDDDEEIIDALFDEMQNYNLPRMRP